MPTKVLTRDPEVLVREQGARPKTYPQSFWTRGATVRGPDRNPWNPDNYPKGPKYARPSYNPFSQPATDPDKLPSYIRRQLEREREGKQWTSRLAPAMRILRFANRAEYLAQIISALTHPVIPNRYSPEIDGMVKCDGPYGPSPLYEDTNGFWFAPGSLHCNPFQLGGQSFGTGWFTPILRPDIQPDNQWTAKAGYNQHMDWTSIPNQLVIGYCRIGGAHWEEHSSWTKVSNPTPDLWVWWKPWVHPAPLTAPAISPFPTANPNVERWTAPDTRPVPQGVPADRVAPGEPYVIAPDHPFGDVLTHVSPAVQRFVGWVPGAFTASGTAISTAPQAKPQPDLSPKVPAPPAARTRERKTMARSRMIGVALFKVLDTISEWGDIVDAVYEALPVDVRERRPCKSRGGVDAFGQYGINVSDCKLQVLWDNWHRLDTEQAVLNIIENELEDRIYGAMHRNLPRGAGGPAMRENWLAFSEALQGFFKPLSQ